MLVKFIHPGLLHNLRGKGQSTPAWIFAENPTARNGVPGGLEARHHRANGDASSWQSERSPVARHTVPALRV